MKPKIENKICAVTVTYGNRWDYLEQVLRRLLGFSEIGNIVVINNGSNYDLSAALETINDGRILLKDLFNNCGSAGGYAAGIRKAYVETTNDFIWLLDDDNLPDIDAIDELLNAWEELGACPLALALYSQRVDRKLDQDFIGGKDPFKSLLVPNAILGVSYFEGVRRKLRKFTGRDLKLLVPQKYIRVPYVPYGGFFVHREMVELIKYPDKDFYLYADDEEYTYRVTQNGGTIWMVTSARVKDIDISDERVSYQPKKSSSPILDLWSPKMYYRVRNSVHFHRKISHTNSLIFTLNKRLFLFKLWRLSVKSGKQQEYRKFKQALNDGLNARLGRAHEERF